MRDLRPLFLSKRTAIEVNYPYYPSENMSGRTSAPSSASSQSVASDCSTPLTPTFSIRGHMRGTSSSSSLSSSPPKFDAMEGPSASGKLPQLTEEPMEPEDLEDDDDFEMADETVLSPCLCDTEHCPHQVTTRSRAVSELPSEPDLDFARASQYEDNEAGSLHYAKRRRSGDSPVNSISTRIEGRFPSLSRRWRDRKRASGLSISTRNLTPSRQPSGSRASSAAGSYQHGYESNVQSPATPPQSILDQQTDSVPMSPAESEAMAHGESIDREALVSTPLLPPMMADDAMGDHEDLQSPLQSPTVADQGQLSSIVNTPIGTPKHHSGMPTPPLSARPSYASMHQGRPGHMVPSSEIPPIMIAGPSDEWADKLGHANFTIHPEPYLPEVYDEDSRRHLFNDWETARRNYTRHQVRTGEHYGVTSKTYMLTEMKWSGIDASWKRNYDAYVAKGGEMSGATAPEAASEPAPLAKMPSITDPRSEGKFPKLGDEDIVGPMAVAPLKAAYADIHRPRGKRAAFVTFLKEMKIPSMFLGRSSFGLRASRR